jgi:hypothetical protein
MQIDLEVLDLLEELRTGDRVGNPGDEGLVLDTAAGWSREGSGGRIAGARAIVAEDATAKVVVRASAVSGHLCTEPVVRNGLVGVYNYVVALAEGEEHPVCKVRLDGH